MTLRRRELVRAGLRWVLAVLYFTVGVIHLRSPDSFLAIMPGWVPSPRNVVLFTGVCEIMGAVGLMVPKLRWFAGAALAAYAVGVFPANIKHAMNSVAIGGEVLGWGYHAPRLLFQPVFVWWALFAGGVVDWPFGRVRD
ncbi:membrane protein [Polymorphobacter glacialis]|uniref:Membrane protein n=1 Tax=Sandarakinorhabdus glacialis TaxID=1614636 RepID=A0A916ZMW4_9SPHN|nr:membrane protein [Polymorphobacter glacialis]